MSQGSAPKAADQRPEEELVPIIGVDIGQKHDPTAIAVVEVEHRDRVDPTDERSRRESHYLVRYLDRLPLGTPYPEVARRLGEICQRVNWRCGRLPDLFVDATGVGQPIVDMLKAAAPQAHLWAVYFTRGDRRVERQGEGRVTLGKAHIVSRLQALLRCQRLHLPANSEARALAEELLSYEIRVDENGHDRFGAFRVGTHDDLVTALALAVQKEPSVNLDSEIESHRP